MPALGGMQYDLAEDLHPASLQLHTALDWKPHNFSNTALGKTEAATPNFCGTYTETTCISRTRLSARTGLKGFVSRWTSASTWMRSSVASRDAAVQSLQARSRISPYASSMDLRPDGIWFRMMAPISRTIGACMDVNSLQPDCTSLCCPETSGHWVLGVKRVPAHA